MRRTFLAMGALGATLAGCSVMLDWKEAEYVGEEPGLDAGQPAGPDAAAPGPDAGARPDASPVDYLAVWGTSEDNVWAVGSGGTIDRWTAAKGWTAWSLPSQRDVDFRGIWGSSPNDVFAVGSGGRILHFDGKAWAPQVHDNRGENLNAIWGFNSGDVFAVGDNTTVAHYNLDATSSELTWGMSCYEPLTVNTCPTAGKLAAAGGGNDPDVVGDKRFLWVGGEKLFRRAQIGSFTHYIAHAVPGFVRGIRVLDRDRGWAVGAGGMLVVLDRSPDRVAIDSKTTQELYGVWASNSQVRAVGNGGTLVCCTLSGTTVQGCAACAHANVPALPGAALRGIWGDESSGEYWVVGLGGVRVHWKE